MKKKHKRTTSILLIFAMLVSVMLPASNSRADSRQKTKGLYEGEGYRVQFDVTEAWDSQYNASVTITNTSEVTIDDWFLKFPFSQKISNVWNGILEKESDGYSYIKNAGHNQDISPGESVTFGMTAEGEWEGYPDRYDLLGKRAVVNDKDYSVSYQVSQDWGSGFIGTVVIKNTSNHIIEDWGIDFRFDNPIQNIWNALIANRDGKEYKIRNAGYNQNIGVGGSVEFGFQVADGDSQNLVQDMCVTNISFEEDGLGSESGDPDDQGETGKDDPEKENPDKGGNSTEEPGKDQTGEILSVSEKGLTLTESGYRLNEEFTTFTGSLKRVEQVSELTVTVYDKKDIIIYQEDIAAKSAWSMKKVGLVYGMNRLVFAALTKDGYTETKEITVQMDSSAYMENLQVDCGDMDNDGLMNYLEDVFGTDKTEKDTDGDGLTDYEELYLFGYHPLEADTDEDGISDYDEDEDEDGISNGEELSRGYLPLDDDSDNDGLMDGEELAFGTSPLNPNTHGKDITDYEEYQLEQLHCDYDAGTGQYTKTFAYEQDAEGYQEPVVPALRFTGDAQGVLSFQMKRVNGSAYLNPSMAGYLGAAFDFTTAGKMKTAELTFTYDETLLGKDLVSQETFCPTIYYYNEETELLEEVEGQVWEGNRVTVTLSHFSTYILANKADLEALWERTQIVDNTLTKGQKPIKETAFVIDYFEGIERYDNNAVFRKKVIYDYIQNRMEENERIYIIITKPYNYGTMEIYGYGNLDKIMVVGKEVLLARLDNAFRIAEHYGPGEYKYYYDNDFDFVATLAGIVWHDFDFFEKGNGIPKQRTVYWMAEGSPYVLNSRVDEILQATKEFWSYSQKYGFTCHMIGFGQNHAGFLRSIAEGTGGNYYQYAPGFDINRCYQDTQPEQSGDDTDKNNDGLNDELEKKICDGEITTITGTTIFSPDSYDKLMKSDDYDGDGLKNGEEIEIYQYRKATYFRLKSLPYLYDSDCDGYSDYEEVKEMNTPPDRANFVMKYSDVSYLNNTDQFESVKAFNQYVDSKGIGNVAAKALDVLFCGGEINLNKAMSKELAECLAEDAKENEQAALAAGIADITNTYVTGLVALLPEMNELDYAFRMDDYMESINNLQKAIQVLKQDGDSQELLRTLQTNLQDHRITWKSDIIRLSEKADKIEKYGTVATFAVGLVSSTADEINEWTEYYAGVSQLVGYRDVLQKLSCCKSENVEVAAKKILKELDGKYGEALGYATVNIFFDFVINIAKFLLTEGLKEIAPYIVLVDITAGIVLGDSMSVGLQNSISVNIALELSTLSNSTVTKNTIQKDCAGDTQVVYDNASNYMLARKLWLSTIHTIKHCEENYQSYIFSDKSLELNRKMLYFSQDSVMNVTNNLIELIRIQNQYVM